MQNLQNELIELLKTQDNLVIDGQLNKNKIIELGLKVEPQLIGLLIKNPTFKKHFLTEVESVLVFDKIKFQRFVNNKSFLPDSYTAFKNKIGLTINDDTTDNFIKAKNDVVLAWPHKDCVLEGGQTKEDQKRNEIFWNETLAPDNVDRLLDAKAFTNFKKYDKDGEHKITELKGDENLILKGNNLLAISSLLKTHRGKIKCIYIDPPYNTQSQANTFAYNNTFNRSTWLVFMKNRLEVAKELLSQDGVMIVAIDKNEQPRLQILIEEIFTSYNIDCITVLHNSRGVIGTNFSYTHEYAIFVTPNGKKSIGNRKIEKEDIDWRQLRDRGGESLRTDAKKCFYPIIVENGEVIGFGDVSKDDEHPKQNEQHGSQIYVYPIDNNGVERKWRYARKTVDTIINVLRVKETKGKYSIEIGKDYGTYKTVWTDKKYDASLNGTQLVKSLIPNNNFTFPKSIYNVIDCINAVVEDDKNAIILDFFGGSGTTAHAVLEINKEDNGNRKFILCEQMNYIQTVTAPRVRKVVENYNSNDSFIYAELLPFNQYFIDKIQSTTTKEGILSVWKEMEEKAFLSFRFNKDIFNERLDAFKTASLETMQQYLVEILDKNQLYVNFSEIEDESFGVSEEDKALNYSFYKANN
jgi:adenine-specific DNA-methyltransferase